MYKDVKKFAIIGTLFTVILGILLHFVYDWTGGNSIVGIFAPVNESVWEHMKLVFYPMTIYLIYGFFKFKKNFSNYTTAAVIGTIGAMLSVVILFYTITGAFGMHSAALNIILFILSVVIGFSLFCFIIKNYALTFISPRLGIVIIELTFLLFALLTIFPPQIPLFTPPVE